MKITLRELRRIIREQVGTMVYIHNAGFGGGMGVSTLRKHKDLPPPGLGGEGEQEKQEHDEEQQQEEPSTGAEWAQWTLRARERTSR
jgi:hypothetical protein